MQNKKLVRTPRGPSYSLPGILLRRWSPEAYVGELVHLWQTVQEQAACGRLMSSLVWIHETSPSTTLLSNPATE